MDPQPSAPPVVAVVVTCNPGPWLEETLLALGSQDYPNLSVLVIDSASTEDPTPRVASVLPGAYVRRLAERVGFSRAANEVLAIVEGASHYLFCHDDVAPEPDTISVLVEEAFRSNAGIVCPKLVDWASPDRLLAVGQSADKTGVLADIVDRGELDQEQHDSVRDVFCAPGGCVLVRADLFAGLRGYDTDVDMLGEDLNLSWRSQVIGGRVVVAPAVRVRHLESLRRGHRVGWDDQHGDRTFALEEAHRLRTVLTCYSAFHLLRVLPQALILTLGQALVQLLTARPGAARSSLLAWPRAVRNPGRLLAARRSVQSQRTVSDAEIRRLQTAGSAHLRAFIRSAMAGESQFSDTGSRRTVAARLASRSWRLPAAAWAVTVVVIVIGSRGLWGHGLPGVGSIPVLSGGPTSWWHLWWSGWRPTGLGSAGPAPTALALLGTGGTLLLGGVGVLQKLLVLGPLIVGPLGAYRAARPLGSSLGRAAALVAYAAVPLPYNALAGGRWSGLVVYAAAPWLLSRLCRLGGEKPFVAPARRPARVLALGLLTALTAAFVPAVLLAVLLMGVGLALGSLLAGRPVAGLRTLATSVAACVVAALLLLPGSVDTLGSRTSTFGVTLAGRFDLADLLRFHTGPVGANVVGWGFLVAAGLPLLIGRSWRLAWATRMWGVALSCWLAAWAAGRGWLPVPLPVPEVLLAPAAAALALSVGLGAVAFRLDLPGYRLGWRQLASLAGAIGLAFGSLPVLGAVSGGRWNLPRRGFGGSVSLVSGDAFRVLWVGDPRALPLGSWQLETGVGYATSDNGPPDVTAAWAPRSAGATPLLGTDLRLARARLTTGLGHLLAPMAVRYIVVPSRTAPAGSGGAAVPVPVDVLAALGQQTDLRALPLDNALTVFENAAWAPARALLSPDQSAASQAGEPTASQTVDLSTAKPVLPGLGPAHYQGPLPANGDVLFSASESGGWKLTVGGQAAARRPAFGWAMAFTAPDQGGKASLHFATPVLARMLLLLQAAVWLAVGAAIVTDRRRHQDQPGADIDSTIDGLIPVEVPPPPPGGDGLRRRPRRVTVPVMVDGDEVWS